MTGELQHEEFSETLCLSDQLHSTTAMPGSGVAATAKQPLNTHIERATVLNINRMRKKASWSELFF